MKIGFYSGSFDPFTIGHKFVLDRAINLFDKVIVGIGVNDKKKRRFDKLLMKNAIDEMLKNEGIDNVECIIYNNLTVDAAISSGANFLIRGIRNGMDYDYEENIASINQEMSGLDTIYIRAGKFGSVSSTLVSVMLENNKDISKYVPKEILKVIK